MKKILLTGIAGFIGFHLSKRLAEEGFRIVGIDSMNDYYDPELKYDRLKALGFDKKEAKIQGMPSHVGADSLFDINAILEFYSR